MGGGGGWRGMKIICEGNILGSKRYLMKVIFISVNFCFSFVSNSLAVTLAYPKTKEK